MIAELAFGDADAQGVRRAHFIPRSSIPLGAACLVANALRETLRELLGERCEVALGEPVAIGAEAWLALSRDAHYFLTYGRQTDIVLVVPDAHARTLVLRAFGEVDAPGTPGLSVLESQALERIATRCASAFDPLCAERRGTAQRISRAELPTCVAYFDVHVRQPIAIELGVAIVRDLPDPGPTGTFPAALLANVPIEVRAEIAAGTIELADLLNLTRGDIVVLETQVGAAATLKVADRSFASGSGGVHAGRYCFEVHAVEHSMGSRS